MTYEFDALRVLVKSVLYNCRQYDWTVQGFGMLRTYIDKDKVFRLNVWDQSLKVQGVSTIHDHPWDFMSWIISGVVTNIRYDEGLNAVGKPHDYMLIKTGIGGGPRSSAGFVRLMPYETEHYIEGDSYTQVANEIHESQFINGTVTLNRRTKRGDGEHARVFWPTGEQWIDAMPYEASESVMNRVISHALTLF